MVGAEKINVFYTTITPRENQTIDDVMLRARAIGYELVQFEGWTDADCTKRYSDVDANSLRIQEIERSQEIKLPPNSPMVDPQGKVLAYSDHLTDAPEIKSFQEIKTRVLEDDEALSIVRGIMGGADPDL